MKKRIISVLVVLSLMLGLAAACGGDAGTSAAESQASAAAAETSAGEASTAAAESPAAGGQALQPKQGDKYRIALLPTDMAATFASWLAQELEKEVAKYPNMELTILDSKNVLSTQLANLENCVAQNYDYVILHPLEPDAEADIVDEYVSKGTPIMMINQSDGGSKLCSNVDADPIEQGAVVAEVAFEKIPQNGKVVILMGPSGNSHSIGRREGFQQYLFDKRPDIEILDEQLADWEKSKGMNYMEDWMQAYPQIDAVVSMNDAMALGAIEAAKLAGRDAGMTFYGVDGLADAVLSIEEGGLTATCVQNAMKFAETAFDIIDRVFKGEIDYEKTLIPGQLIDANNVAEWIEIHKANGQIN